MVCKVTEHTNDRTYNQLLLPGPQTNQIKTYIDSNAASRSFQDTKLTGLLVPVNVSTCSFLV